MVGCQDCDPFLAPLAKTAHHTLVNPKKDHDFDSVPRMHMYTYK